MFGYIEPDFDNIYPKDSALYKAVYCGLCQTLKKYYGNFARLSLNFDSVFLSIVLHNFLGEDYEIEQKLCAKHWLKKRNMSKSNLLDKIVVSFNLMLVKYKFVDEKIDGQKSKKVMKFLLAKAMKKASKEYPEVDKIIKDGMAEIWQLEKENCDCPDKIAVAFSNILTNFMQNILEDKFCEEMRLFVLHLGKYIYLIDAYDDLQKDFEQKNYNVFLKKYADFQNLKDFLAKHEEEIQFLLYIDADFVLEYANRLKFFYNCDIIYNIANYGLKKKILQIQEKVRKK